MEVQIVQDEKVGAAVRAECTVHPVIQPRLGPCSEEFVGIEEADGVTGAYGREGDIPALAVELSAAIDRRGFFEFMHLSIPDVEPLVDMGIVRVNILEDFSFQSFPCSVTWCPLAPD